MNILTGVFLAIVIELTPFYDKYDKFYLGEFPDSTVCEGTFSFGPGTVLAPNTQLNVSPFKEIYGLGSNPVGGGTETCGTCAVHSYDLDAAGVTRFYCDVY